MYTKYRRAIASRTYRLLPILLCVARAVLSESAVTAGTTDTNVRVNTTLKIIPAAEGVIDARLTFGPILSGYAYTVETCPNLAAANWTALAPDQVTDIGGQRALIDAPLVDVRKFYRVTVTSQPPALLQVRLTQPRLFWNSQIAANVGAKPSDSDDFFYNVRKRKMKKFPASPAALNTTAIAAEMQAMVSNNTSGAFFDTAMDYGLCAFLSQGTAFAPAYRAYAESFLAALCARTFTPDEGDLGPREKLYSLGVLYDWLTLDASTALGRTVHQKVLDGLQSIDADPDYEYFSRPCYSGGHDRYANVCALAALLAIRHGIVNDPDADLDAYYGWLALVVRNWREGYSPTQAWMAQDGGHGMGCP